MTKELNIHQETEGNWRGMWVAVFRNGMRVAYTTREEAVTELKRRKA